MRSPVSRIVATSLSPPQPLPPPPSHKTINLQAPATQHISGEVRGIKNTRFLKRHLFGSKRPSLSKVATFLNFHNNNLSILTFSHFVVTLTADIGGAARPPPRATTTQEIYISS